ncbi:MAG: PCI domain-containing protein, partial [archaeon]|nr:PCI domain-containing protein [archaeon]
KKEKKNEKKDEKKDKEEEKRKRHIERPKAKKGEDEEKKEDKKKEEEIITPEKIDKELEEISNQRGQTKSPIEIISRMDFLLSKSDNVIQKIKLISLEILICFDSSPGQFSSLNLSLWDKIHSLISTVIDLYDQIKDKEGKEIAFGVIQNNLVSLLEKLEMELYRALQYTDNDSTEYMLRVKDEARFISLCLKVENFYKQFNNKSTLARINMLCLLHIYYKNNYLISKAQKESPEVNKLLENPSELVDNYCKEIYLHLDDKQKIKAILLQIIFHSIHDNYPKAKSLFESTHLYELVSKIKEDNVKSLYNRTLAYIGLCCFRQSKYGEALQYLSPICSFGITKLKEFIAQSYNKEIEKNNIIFDKEDKKRATPHIMSLSIEEIEAVFYLSSMIVDLPWIILNHLGGDSKRGRRYGLFFRKVYLNYDKQVFKGPSENNKDRVLNSCMLLLKGDWQNAKKEIDEIKLFKKYKNHQIIYQNLEKNCKCAGIKCFLMNNMKIFKSISLDYLSRKFELEEKQTMKVINEMIKNKQIKARWINNIIMSTDNCHDNQKTVKTLYDNVNYASKLNVDIIEMVCNAK